MKMSVRKLEVADAAALEKLVVEHIDGIESGLSVVESRLVLGDTTIDLVAQDASGSLVLIALGSKTDENMLLRIIDAYSWCLEYPEAVQRHYPALAVSEERPPRVVFVMPRVPESFQRRIKQLSFPSVDAVEFHHLEVNGVPTVFFDAVSRIRRGMAAAPPAPVVTPDIAVRPALRETVLAAVDEDVELLVAPAIAGGSDAPSAVPYAPETVEAADAPVAADDDDAPAADLETKYPSSEAARATKIAHELGIQLPTEGALSRQWIDFLNQMAAK